jgi:ubiquinone/menaquinone biosynthesis C-methylase UbiE
VLECGVGTARNLDLYPPACEVIGVDYSQKALEVAYTKNTLTNITFKLEDVDKYQFTNSRLSFKDNQFDTVVDTFGLEYYINPR